MFAMTTSGTSNSASSCSERPEGLLYYLQYYYGFPLFNLVAPMNIAITVGVIFILGIVISLFSSMFAVGKYLRIKTNDLYYI